MLQTCTQAFLPLKLVKVAAIGAVVLASNLHAGSSPFKVHFGFLPGFHYFLFQTCTQAVLPLKGYARSIAWEAASGKVIRGSLFLGVF